MSGEALGKHCGACCTKLVNLGVSIGGRAILEDINLHMHCGQISALIGPNGAGKTTLLRAILGEIPCTGELQFMPFNDSSNRRPRMGYVPQRLDMDRLSPVTVEDLFAAATGKRPIWMGTGGQMRKQIGAALALAKAESLAGNIIGDLSGGELQRVLLALALTPMPEMLLLDEPVSGVDHAGVALIYRILSELRENYDVSILLVSHDLRAVADVADRMLFLNKKIHFDGAPKTVLAEPMVRQVMGFDFPEHHLPPPPAVHVPHTGKAGREGA